MAKACHMLVFKLKIPQTVSFAYRNVLAPAD
jgi:hypothetical protein